MKYLTNVFKESLRLYPPVGFFARESKEETTMRKKLIKKGAGIVVAPWLIHRHEDFLENPHEFDPSRHEDKGNIQKGTYLSSKPPISFHNFLDNIIAAPEI